MACGVDVKSEDEDEAEPFDGVNDAKMKAVVSSEEDDSFDWIAEGRFAQKNLFRVRA